MIIVLTPDLEANGAPSASSLPTTVALAATLFCAYALPPPSDASTTAIPMARIIRPLFVPARPHVRRHTKRASGHGLHDLSNSLRRDAFQPSRPARDPLSRLSGCRTTAAPPRHTGHVGQHTAHLSDCRTLPHNQTDVSADALCDGLEGYRIERVLKSCGTERDSVSARGGTERARRRRRLLPARRSR
jgi:hypothetical protein